MATTTPIVAGNVPVISADGRFIAFVGSILNTTNNVQNISLIQDLDTGEQIITSVSSDGVLANGLTSRLDSIAISEDGRFIVFSSNSTNLVPNDTNEQTDLFMRDAIAGTTTLISIDSDGSQIPNNLFDDDTFRPSVSTDGKFVAFQTAAPFAGNSTGQDNIFVRDIVSGTTELISVDSSGTQGNQVSSSPSLSADGRYVAFESLANNLVSGDTFSDPDIFVHDRLSKTTIMASVNTNGEEASGISEQEGGFGPESTNPIISPDGQFIIFESTATNLVPNDTNQVKDIFMHDLQTRQTTRISVDSNGNQANGSSSLSYTKSAISADGRFIVFQSVASNLVPSDNNNGLDIFLRDIVDGTTTRISVSSNGDEALNTIANVRSSGGTISADGQRIVFRSNAQNFNDDGSGAFQIYLRQLDRMPLPTTNPPNPTDEDPNHSDSPEQNKLTGTPENDRLTGTNSKDFLLGKAGNDILVGKKGRDVLGGNKGNDTLIGGQGRDLLTGGGGADRFIYRTPQDGVDRITDFKVRKDKIVLSKLLNRLVGTNYRGQNAIVDGLIRLKKRGINTRIDIDLNGPSKSGGFKPLILVENLGLDKIENPNNFIF